MAKTGSATVRLSDETVGILNDLARRGDTTLTEVLKQAIAVQKFLCDEQDAGKHVLIEDPASNTTRRLVLK